MIIPDKHAIAAIMNLAAPYGERAGWTRGAVETFVRERLDKLLRYSPAEFARAPGGVDPKVQWVMDNICCAILNESFGP